MKYRSSPHIETWHLICCATIKATLVINGLIDFKPVIPFYTPWKHQPWKHQKTCSLNLFSGYRKGNLSRHRFKKMLFESPSTFFILLRVERTKRITCIQVQGMSRMLLYGKAPYTLFLPVNLHQHPHHLLVWWIPRT